MSTIDRVKKNLKNNYFAKSQFASIGMFFVHLLYRYEAEKAGSICEWAISHLANDGYVRKGSLKTLGKILGEETLSETDREYAEIVKDAVESYDFGLERTPKHWDKG